MSFRSRKGYVLPRRSSAMSSMTLIKAVAAGVEVSVEDKPDEVVPNTDIISVEGEPEPDMEDEPDGAETSVENDRDISTEADVDADKSDISVEGDPNIASVEGKSDKAVEDESAEGVEALTETADKTFAEATTELFSLTETKSETDNCTYTTTPSI